MLSYVQGVNVSQPNVILIIMYALWYRCWGREKAAVEAWALQKRVLTVLIEARHEISYFIVSSLLKLYLFCVAFQAMFRLQITHVPRLHSMHALCYLLNVSGVTKNVQNNLNFRNSSWIMIGSYMPPNSKTATWTVCYPWSLGVYTD